MRGEREPLHDAAGDADTRERPRPLPEREDIHLDRGQVRALEQLAHHRHQQFRMAVVRHRLFHEELAATQQRDGAQLRGGFDGEEIQGCAAAGNKAL